MKNSAIEWTDHTFNPWEGCTKVSPGCAHCYAEARNARFGGGQAPNWGPGAPRRRTSEANWRKPLQWAAEQRDIETTCALDKKPYRRPRVFCASLADWLDDEVPVKWLADLLELIRLTPELDWLLLTKRPQNWLPRLKQVYSDTVATRKLSDWVLSWFQYGQAPTNVWIGTTVEDQPRADERIPELLKIPAKIRFLSCEPLLGPVDLTRWLDPTGIHCMDVCPDSSFVDRAKVETVKRGAEVVPLCQHCGIPAEWTGYDECPIHWVIVGGESGPGARPMHPAWARSLRDQCAAAGVPFFFKQWGEWSPYTTKDEYTEKSPLTLMKESGELSWWAGNEDTTVNCSENLEETDQPIERVGKKTAGRLLDGVEHSAFPASAVSTPPPVVPAARHA